MLGTTIISVSESAWTAVSPNFRSYEIKIQQQPNAAVSNWVATAAFFLADGGVDAPISTTGPFRPPGDSQTFKVPNSQTIPVAWIRLPSGGGTVNFQQLEQY